MALPPLKPKTESKPGLPPLPLRKITGRTSTAEPTMNNVPTSVPAFKKGDEVRIDPAKINPSGVFRLATEVYDHRIGTIVLLEWEDPIDHPSCNKRHVWAHVRDLEKVTK